MANLGAEVSRLLAARVSGDARALDASLSRSLEILEKIQRLESKGSRQNELLLLKEAVLNASQSDAVSESANLEAYFVPFAKRLLYA